MFELFLRSGAFTEKCLGRVCFEYCACALSEKTKVQSDYLITLPFTWFVLMRVDKQYMACASANLLNKLRKILKYLVPEFLLFFFTIASFSTFC